MWTTQRESRPAGSDLSYRLVRRLNEDAIGALWIAEGADSGQVVTLRTLRDELVDHERFARWLRLELRPVSLLRHPSVLEVRSDDGDAHGQIAHIAMAAFEGESLARRLDGAGPLDRAAATAVAQRVRAALEAAHQIGLVHGCVSADSVLISADGDVRVIDFGIPTALWLAARHGQRSSNGSGGSHAPQLTGRAPDEAHDDRSVELLVRHMLSGHRPPEDELETLVQLVLADPRPSSSVSGAPPAPTRTRRIAVGAAIVAAATVAVVGFAAIRSPSENGRSGGDGVTPTPSSVPSAAPAGGIAVPEVEGLSAMEAERLLVATGLVVRDAEPTTGPPGEVVGSDPPSNQLVPPGSAITIYVGAPDDRQSGS